MTNMQKEEDDDDIFRYVCFQVTNKIKDVYPEWNGCPQMSQKLLNRNNLKLTDLEYNYLYLILLHAFIFS